ncbi:FMRFamide-activated amiloride-sensitive sodium channel-like [Mytilus trossulus]|uniref:FMRFamide-activated amiloride-sensitive sodium channel-like n=1 Tax=Mytilus trossulus TaxID=6551 RepID=UPI003003F85D
MYGRHDVRSKSRDEDYFNGSEYFKNTKSTEPPVDYGDKLRENEETESLDSEGKQKSFNRLCVRFAEKTSMQGLPWINAAKLWYAKVFWVFLLLCGIAGMTLHLYSLIEQFLQFDVQVSISLGFNHLVLPAVTVCNVNAVKKSELNIMSEALQSLVTQTDPARFNGPPGKKRKKRYVDEFDNINFDNLSRSYDFTNKGGQKKDNNFQITQTFQALYMQHPRSTRRKAGHQLNNLLIGCSFGGYQCYQSNFTWFQTEDYGNCFTIQSEEFVVTSAGPDNGLDLTLYTETEEYLAGITQGYGARIQIHDRYTYPFPSDEGEYVASGFETHVALKQVELIRKGSPYGECQDVTAYLSNYGAKYTRTLCQNFCKQQLIVDSCGCFDNAESDLFFTLNYTFSVVPCLSETERVCLAQLEADLKGRTLECPECVKPCQETQFGKSFSARNWPTDEYANVLMEGVCEKLPKQACDQMASKGNDYRALGHNFVKIKIYFEDLNYELIEETPEIEVQQFASDVGGAIGLWIGLSIISMFELFQLMLECCAFGVHKCRTPPEPKKKQSDKYKEKSNPSVRKDTRQQELPKHYLNGNVNHYSDWKNRV